MFLIDFFFSSLYGISRLSGVVCGLQTIIPKSNPNEVIVTHCKLAGSTKIWYLSIVEQVDGVFADVQMCSVQFRSCDSDFGHVTTMRTVMHILGYQFQSKWLPEWDISFLKFITQLLLEYDASVSRKGI